MSQYDPHVASQANPTVAVLVGSLRAYHRRAILGIMKHQHVQRAWTIVTDPIEMQERPVPSRFFGVDGAIVDHGRRKDLLPLIDRGIPLVNLRTSLEIPEAGHVSNDGAAIARMAVSHFADRQFTNVAFCGWQRGAMNIRRDRYEQEIARRKMKKFIFRPKSRTPGEGKDVEQLSKWLLALPKPIGILAHNDVRGRIVIDVCNMIGLRVPDEVAVLGVDDEMPYCLMCQPALSSVRVDAERIGYEAAAMLQRMLKGEPIGRCGIMLIPATRS